VKADKDWEKYFKFLRKEFGTFVESDSILGFSENIHIVGKTL